MEFHEKLQKLRASENLTQEELAEKLYVSRTAISKWESGRGYPSIDSLKTIAKYFNITIDELICSDEMVTLAEQDKKESKKKYTSLICGIVDCLIVLIFFLPLFASKGTNEVTAVNILSLTGVSQWLKIVFIVIAVRPAITINTIFSH
ncbi:MAG: helix-turn-helix domain-containing protein [Clostridiales bacterium]|nr:helix-turn-helix domain-containing protein [Clostridiales bacterium]